MLGALLLAACAGPAGERTNALAYRFPEAFEATQVVTATAGDETRDFLASVSRRGDDYEVTLFDAVFATPLLSARLRGGTSSEEQVAGASVPAGEGRRLVELVRQVYVARYPAPEKDRTSLDATGFGAVLAQFREYPDCLFPASIEIRPRQGPVGHVSVRTVDLLCEARRSRPR